MGQGFDIVYAYTTQVRYHSLLPGTPGILSHIHCAVIIPLTRKMHFGKNNGKFHQKEVNI